MTTTVLAYIPSPSQGVWHLGPFPVRAYALFIIIGIIAALVIGDRRWVARGGEPGVIYDIALWAVPFGLIGGRLYHVITDWPTYFGEGGAGPAAALRIWDGGLGIWGAVALGGIGAWIACRRRGIPLPAFGDAIAPGIVLAQAIGRLGNYFNQELFGRETTVPWGLEIYERVNAAGVPDSLNGVSTGELIQVVHPTFLYELLWNLLVFAVLILVDRRFKIGHGRLFALYVAGYCVGRFWIELMRSDTATLLAGIRVNSFTSTFVFIGAVVYIMAAPKGREDPSSLKGNQDAEARVEELAKDVAAGSATGIVAAATVADEDEAMESADDDAAAEVEALVAELEASEPETEGLGSVEGDEVAEAVEVAPEVHEAAVEGEAEAESEVVEGDVESVTESEGLGSVEGDEVAEAVEVAPEVHEVVVEGEAEAEALAADADAEAEDLAADVEAESPVDGAEDESEAGPEAVEGDV
ncbi:prolipoprotein diacylglyceryl transferase, partial [Mycolicibacterium sp.]